MIMILKKIKLATIEIKNIIESEEFTEHNFFYLKETIKILKEFDNKEFPLLIGMIKCICENKKLKINWQ